MEFFWIAFLIIYIGGVVYFSHRPLPPGLDYSGPVRRLSGNQVRFVYDLTWWENGIRKTDHQILDTICDMIGQADRFVVVDMFLFNLNKAHKDFFLPTTRRLVECLKNRIQQQPDLKVYFITDPINDFYGSYRSGPLQALREAGVHVIITDVNKLRDRHYLYAGFWRLFLQWFGTRGKGWIPDPLERIDGKITLRALLKALNARANHRKLVICDHANTYRSMVSSANIHEASSWLSNIAFVIEDGLFAKDSLRVERAVARISGQELPDLLETMPENEEGPVQIQLFTERKIEAHLLEDIRSAGSTDTIEIAMLFLSDGGFIRALLAAAERGARIVLILDQNTQSFGAKKMGLPNQVTAIHLMRASKNKIRVLWWKSTQEEFHPKLMLMHNTERAILYGGSANLTHRNIAGYSLEDMVRIEAPPSEAVVQQVLAYFRRIQDSLFTQPAQQSCKGFRRKQFVFFLQQLSGITTY